MHDTETENAGVMMLKFVTDMSAGGGCCEDGVAEAGYEHTGQLLL